MAELVFRAVCRFAANAVYLLVWLPIGLLFLIYLTYIVVSIIMELRK
ncbi:MAG: hypothetical protein IJT94_12520 [Oscillibacter sp.]|nr:hypothetical protein [Oscillibacter sp.]